MLGQEINSILCLRLKLEIYMSFMELKIMDAYAKLDCSEFMIKSKNIYKF